VGHPQLVNLEAIRRFLFEQTQHRIGGFGKAPGNPPGTLCPLCCSRLYFDPFTDIYHSYLGLAALATMKEPGLKPLDPALCVSVEQREKIEKFRNESLGRI
jgi:geranylgeranyl transferase type-1 subunit beta